MDGPGGDNNSNIHDWGDIYGRSPWRAGSTSWSSRTSAGIHGASYYDTASSSSAYDAGGTYWSAAEERVSTPLSSVYSYHRRSDPDPPVQPRERHYAGGRSSPLHFGSKFTDLHSVWATDIEEPVRCMSTCDVVSRDSSPMMSGALPPRFERERRFSMELRQVPERIRVEQLRRSRSSAGRRSSHSDSRPHFDHHPHHQDHCRYHHGYPCTCQTTDHYYSWAQSTTQAPHTSQTQRRRPTRTLVVRVEEQCPCRDERGRRHRCYCRHGKHNLAMKFVKYAAGMPWPRS